MLATEILTQDHREVEVLIEQLEGVEENSTTARATFEQLRNALAMHMRAEEEIYYPTLAKHEEFSDLMEDAVSEHEGVKENLMQMNELDPGTDEFRRC